MAVKRALEETDIVEARNAIQEGNNPIEMMVQEFRNAIHKNTQKLEKLTKTADDILKIAMEKDSISDQTRALREVRDSLGQEIKNWIALQQYGIKQSDHIQSAIIRNESDIKLLLVEYVNIIKDEVCPICKSKIIPKIIELTNKEEEEKEEWKKHGK